MPFIGVVISDVAFIGVVDIGVIINGFVVIGIVVISVDIYGVTSVNISKYINYNFILVFSKLYLKSSLINKLFHVLKDIHLSIQYLI